MTRRVLLDTSSFQPGAIDWGRIHRESGGEVVGGIIKATEGEWKYSNPGFETQLEGLHAAGMVGGAYTFWHPGFAGTADAQMFLDRIYGHKLELGVWYDCEVSDNVPASQMLDRLFEDMNLVEARYPGRVGIYSAPWWWDPNTVGSAARHVERFPLWLAGYTQNLPPSPVPWRSPLIWQFTDHYSTYFGPCDASIFMGTDAQWAWLTGGSGGTPPQASGVKGIQAAVHAKVDGVFGKDTDSRCEGIRVLRVPAQRNNHDKVRYAQQVMAFSPASTNGNWDGVTATHWTETVKAIQLALGVGADGVWGPGTDAAYLKLNPLR